MTKWSEEALWQAELQLAKHPGTWRDKIGKAIDAAIAQRELEEAEERRSRLQAKIDELECHNGSS